MVYINRIKFCTLISVFFFGTVAGFTQNSVTTTPQVDRLLSIYASKNKKKDKVKAWRIQIAALSDRRMMETEKTRFENIYPNIRLEWIHDNPYYILKIKDAVFKDKLDALRLLHRIKRRYQSAILVLDDVEPDEILNNNF